MTTVSSALVVHADLCDRGQPPSLAIGPTLNSLIPHPGKQLLFVLLSLSDLLLTWWLLGHSSGQAYEGNPFADWWLAHYGWPGLAAFKVGAVLLVVALAVVISRSRPRAGARLLKFACAALALVVCYSLWLCRGLADLPDAEQMEAAQQFARHLEGEYRQEAAYRALLEQAAKDLVAARCTLAEAVGRLADSERGKDLAWRRALTCKFQGRPLEECLAASVIYHAVEPRQEDPRVARLLARRLERDFRLIYGTCPPSSYLIQR